MTVMDESLWSVVLAAVGVFSFQFILLSLSTLIAQIANRIV